eukprot:TRINITY_DN45200_c0_g1_i1.p1 TRINITY_DN45200_c0_g1~~TRINITY_DN45200_c0_g1_i1.p1  ORF type:complete len:158 (-),score=20.25 TRINITY_DN45200_c0_g1_i1:129-602(-)
METAALTSTQRGLSTPQGKNACIVIVGGNQLLQEEKASLTRDASLRTLRSNSSVASRTSLVTPHPEHKAGFDVESQKMKGGPFQHVPCVSRIGSIPPPKPSAISSRKPLPLQGVVKQETRSTNACLMALKKNFANIEERITRLEKLRGLPRLESQRA